MAGVIFGISLAVITVRNYESYEFEFDILISKPKIYISFYLRPAKYIGMYMKWRKMIKACTYFHKKKHSK